MKETIEQKINRLQKSIILHSYIYYELVDSIINDKIYDKMCHEYLTLIKDYDIKKSKFYIVFRDFDGTTGFDLYYKLQDHQKEGIKVLAKNMVNYHKNVYLKG